MCHAVNIFCLVDIESVFCANLIEGLYSYWISFSCHNSTLDDTINSLSGIKPLQRYEVFWKLYKKKKKSWVIIFNNNSREDIYLIFPKSLMSCFRTSNSIYLILLIHELNHILASWLCLRRFIRITKSDAVEQFVILGECHAVEVRLG